MSINQNVRQDFLHESQRAPLHISWNLSSLNEIHMVTDCRTFKSGSQGPFTETSANETVASKCNVLKDIFLKLCRVFHMLFMSFKNLLLI